MHTVTNTDREKLLKLINGDELSVVPKNTNPPEPKGPSLFGFRLTWLNKILSGKKVNVKGAIVILCAFIAIAIMVFFAYELSGLNSRIVSSGELIQSLKTRNEELVTASVNYKEKLSSLEEMAQNAQADREAFEKMLSAAQAKSASYEDIVVSQKAKLEELEKRAGAGKNSAAKNGKNPLMSPMTGTQDLSDTIQVAPSIVEIRPATSQTAQKERIRLQ